MNRKELREQYRNIVDTYVREFVAKHDYNMSDYEIGLCWVADDAGTTACIGDMFVDFNDIRYDIDNDVPEPKFEEWYWTSLERAELGIKYMNYESFCKGAPDPVPPESMNEIIALRNKLNDIRMQLFRASSEYRDEKLPNYM